MFRYALPPSLAIAAVLALSCARSPHSAKNSEPPVLHVVTPGDYAPFAHCTDTAPPICEGFDVDLLQSFATSEGIEIEWTSSRWSTLAKDLETHDLAIGGITVRPEREALGHFSDPLIATGKQALMRCDDRERFGSWTRIASSARIVANLGGGNETFARSHFAGASLRILATNDEVPAALLAGQGDVFFTDGPEAALLARTHEALCVGLGGALYQPFSLAFWFAPRASALRDRFNRFLRSPPGLELVRTLRTRYHLD